MNARKYMHPFVGYYGAGLDVLAGDTGETKEPAPAPKSVVIARTKPLMINSLTIKRPLWHYAVFAAGTAAVGYGAYKYLRAEFFPPPATVPAAPAPAPTPMEGTP